MRTRTLVVLIAFFDCLAGSMAAQENDGQTKHRFVQPYVETMMENADGYEGPGFVSRPGVELWIKRLNINFESAISTTDKKVIHSGTAYKVNGNGYFNFRKYFLGGGGYTWGKLVTSQWTKESSHPYISGGVMCLGDPCDGWRVLYDYVLAGTDIRNGVRGSRFHVLVPVYKRRLFFNGGVAFYSAYETDCPSCKRSGTAAVEYGLRYQR